MAVLDIYVYPHPVLRKKTKPVTKFDSELHKFIDNMVETMYAAQGLGLAAPQVGDSRQIVVIDIGEPDPATSLIELVNPTIVEYGEEANPFDEGCLSFPDIWVKVDRHDYVKVQAQDRNGETFTVEGEGLLAVALQHELDHLKGNLLADHMGRFRLNQVRKRLKRRYDKNNLQKKIEPKKD